MPMFIHHSILKEIVCPTLAGYAATHCKEMMIMREEGHHVQTHYIKGITENGDTSDSDRTRDDEYHEVK